MSGIARSFTAKGWDTTNPYSPLSFANHFPLSAHNGFQEQIACPPETVHSISFQDTGPNPENLI
jgi:hypothetical protein